MNAVAGTSAGGCAGDTLVVLTARLVLMVMMVVVMVMVMVVMVVVTVVMMIVVVVMLLLATATLRLALLATLVTMTMVAMVVVSMVMAMMMMAMVVMMVLLLLLAVTVACHAAIIVIIVMVVMMRHITLQLGGGLGLRDAKDVTSGQVAGTVQPRVGQLQILNSSVVDCGNVLAVVTVLNHVLCLACKTAMATGLLGALWGAGGIHGHRLDRGLGHRTVLGVSLGVVNALGHRPGADHGGRAHSGLDYCRWVRDLQCAGACDCDALLADSCHCWRWLVAFAPLTMIQLQASITQAGCILVCCIPCCNVVVHGSGGNGVGPVEKAFSLGQCEAGAQEKNGRLHGGRGGGNKDWAV